LCGTHAAIGFEADGLNEDGDADGNNSPRRGASTILMGLEVSN
jgi:hypothetical protein